VKMLRKFKVAVVVRTSVRLHPMRTEVRTTLEKLPKAIKIILRNEIKGENYDYYFKF